MSYFPKISDLAEKVLPMLVEKFENGVKAVREFNDQFGEQIMERLKKSFQAFRDIATILVKLSQESLIEQQISKVADAQAKATDRQQDGTEVTAEEELAKSLILRKST